MTDDTALKSLRHFARREYLRNHEKGRRAGAKAEVARRIDVTPRGEMLDGAWRSFSLAGSK